MRIVITGASGNIGTALLRRLRRSDLTGLEVVGVCRRPPEPVEPYAGVRWVSLDLSAPAPALAPVVEDADAVVHLAWGFQPSHDVAYLERLGVGGTRAVVEAAQAAGVPHLVHLSSLGAYSPGADVPVDESWPTRGIETLAYSRHKVAAERLLDEHDRLHPDGTAVARMRPGLVVQRAAASALLRYGMPALVPSALLRHVPLLPLDRDLVVPVVHADDVADAIVRVLERRATGAFNLAADPPVDRGVIAAALRARPVHLPAPVLRAAAALAWRLRLQPLDPGWLDLAFAVPLLDSTRARTELGWTPSVPADAALREVLAGMAERAASASPVLRRRTVLGELDALVRSGPIGSRARP